MLELGNLRHYATGEKIAIQIGDGKILGITGRPTTMGWINCNSGLVVPGLIDGHVHDRLGQPEKELPTTLVRSAILGGVTTIAKMPNTLVPATRASIIHERAVQDRGLTITTKFWLGATADNLSEMIEVINHLRNVVIGVKIYMGSSTGNLLVCDPAVLRKIFKRCAQIGLMVAVHAEDEGLMKRNLERYGPKGENAAIADHCVIRSTEVEVSAVRTALFLQEQTHCKLYFCHISTPESLELIQDAKQKGRTVFAEVCPHHLYLNSEQLRGANGGLYKMNPPLRTDEQVKRLCEYVCQPGWVDVIGTDHAPHHLNNEKRGQPYANTASGVPGLQTMLPLMYNFVRYGEMSIRHFVNITSANAAKIFGLRGKGELLPGADADITVIDDFRTYKLRHEDMATLHPWTPFDGEDVCAKATFVVAKGVLVLRGKPML
jgi:dihydroorotase